MAQKQIAVTAEPQEPFLMSESFPAVHMLSYLTNHLHHHDTVFHMRTCISNYSPGLHLIRVLATPSHNTISLATADLFYLLAT